MQRSKIWQPRTRTRVIILFLLLVVPALNGCARLAPKTAALEKIHESYRTEFVQLMQLMVPKPGDKSGSSTATANQALFAETLREIRDYRIKYDQESQEAYHLTILEGMIYLQSRQFGLARLIRDDVKTAGTKLKSGTGDSVRDKLLADNFQDLLDGWQEILKIGTPQALNTHTLVTATRNIERNLSSKETLARIKPETDDGAIYIATTAAIFYLYVYDQCRQLGPSADCDQENTKPHYYGLGANLIGLFLSEKEKALADKPDAVNDLVNSAPMGRWRYIGWYSYLQHPPQQ